MPSVIEGYEYDIFISYRHKDNLPSQGFGRQASNDGWVTEFVDNLRKELEATFKEDVSLYFDQNPHDGLLEIHNVDKTIEQKLKCLIFIPIISQTYCDPKCFAWRHEFLAFTREARKDILGLDVKLSNGNIASRILPVLIHDLMADDRELLSSKMEGVFRAIEFIYRGAGVNRPLRPSDDTRASSSRPLFYRDQINKVANAIRDITLCLTRSQTRASIVSPLAAFDFLPLREGPHEKSIIVLPFVNIGDDSAKEYFSDGLTEEVITDLSYLHNLLVISRSSSMTYKGTRKKITEISSEVNVRYVLEGSVRFSGNNLRVTVQLIDAQTDCHLWADRYNGVLEDIFVMQEKISRQIAESLEIKLTAQEKKKISYLPIDDITAYDYYLRGKRELVKWNVDAVVMGMNYLKKALELTGPNSLVYSAIAYAYWSHANLGVDHEKNLTSAKEYLIKTFEIDPSSVEANFIAGMLAHTFGGDLKKGIDHFRIVLSQKPNDYDTLLWIGLCYLATGQIKAARQVIGRMVRMDPLSVLSGCANAVMYFYTAHFDEALVSFKKCHEAEPENNIYQVFYALTLAYNNRRDEVVDFVESKIPESASDFILQIPLMLKEAFEGKKDQAKKRFSSEMESFAKLDFQYSHFLASACCYADMKIEAISWLENSISRGFCNYLFLSHDPSLASLHEDPTFEQLLVRVKNEMDGFGES